MRVKFIFAQGIEQNTFGQQATTRVINPVVVFRVPFIPGTLTLAAIMILTDIEYRAIHKAQVLIHDPNNIEVFNSDPLEFSHVEIDNFNVNANVNNMVIRADGEYTIKLILDGQEFTDTFCIIGEKKLVEAMD